MAQPTTHFPFTAVVGADDMALALVLNAISPELGGVLVRGEKGTAKSTMVRALASLLPDVAVVDDCRFTCDPADPDPTCPDGPHLGSAAHHRRRAHLVELPVGATEDRVIGSLHLQRALSEGVAAYEPGLLAAAHRGLLYVDEVNLLHDHLVDVLLDASAMGRSTVEREGVSVAHDARFVLVGTMNPEEGELRPQLLDRFGLTVEIAAPRDPAVRVEVVRRRLAHDADPAAFTAAYEADEAAMAARIDASRAKVGAVALDDDALTKIAEVCAAFEVDGMRADIVTARAARAHAAWDGRDRVVTSDIRAAARLSIPHRRRRDPFDAPGLDEDLLDKILGDDEPDPEPPDQPPEGPPTGGGEPSESPDGSAPNDLEPTEVDGTNQGPGDDAPEAVVPPPPAGESSGDGAPDRTSVTGPGSPYRTRLFSVSGTGHGESGRRSRAVTSTGRTTSAQPSRGRSGPLHLVGTIRAAAVHQRSRGRTGGRVRLEQDDLRLAVREGRESNLVLFCVDASGSMAARKRMEQVKSAVLSLLLDAYQRRDKVGLVTFRAGAADLALPPTSSVDIAASRLADLPAGGRTPLAEGLVRAAEVLRVEAVRDPRRRPLLVVVTDGRATSGADALARAHRAADFLAAQEVASVVIDCETGRFRMGLAARLAEHLRAEYVPLGEVAAEALTAVVHERAS